MGDLAGGGAATADPLLTGLKAYWKLDEASGTRSDSIGAYTLTDNNTVGSAVGKIGNAASSVAASSEYLSLPGATMDEMLPIGCSYSFCCWVKWPNGFPFDYAYGVPVGWDSNNTYSQRFRVMLMRYPYGNHYATTWSIEQSGQQALDLGAGFDPTAWHFMAWTYDADAQQARVQVDGNADEVAAAAPYAPFQGPSPLTIPHWVYFNVDHDVDEVAIWTRALSRAERERVYNSGSGLSLV